MFRLGSLLARALRAASRRLGRSGGTTAPGRPLPAYLPHRAAAHVHRAGGGHHAESATNGKTTTCAMAAAALERGGRRVVRNAAGSNMSWGVATALLSARAGGRASSACSRSTRPGCRGSPSRSGRAPTCLRTSSATSSTVMASSRSWRIAGPSSPKPRRVAALAWSMPTTPWSRTFGRDRPGVVYFGLEDDSQALPELQHAADSKHCRNCGAPYAYDAVYLGHLGRYRCENCGRRRPAPDVVATHVELEGMSGSQVDITTPRASSRSGSPSPGSTTSTTHSRPSPSASSWAPASTTSGTASRSSAAPSAAWRRSRSPGAEVSILLVKNPAGANEVLRTLTLEDGSLDLWLALNDRIADGRDVSWIWDADFELLRKAGCAAPPARERAPRRWRCG